MIPDSAALIERGEQLRAYVKETNGIPAEWDGCSTWPAQWVADQTGAAFDMPVYRNEGEGRALLEAEGGLLKIWEQMGREAGLKARYGDPPNVGDVGIIETTRGRVGGIFTFGGGICIRSLEGVAAMSAWGRAFPVRNSDGTWTSVPVVVKVWALD